MPNSILSSLLSSNTFKIINESTNYQIWTRLSIAKVEIGSDSANTDKPLSTQQLTESSTFVALRAEDIQATKMLRPSRLRITAFCSDVSTIESIQSIFADITSSVSVTSKAIITDSLVITKLSISQSSEMLSASKIVMEFEQGMPPQPQTFSPAQSADANVYGVRVQTPTSLLSGVNALYTNVQSAVSRAATTVGGLI